jgi:RNA polymerase sigma-70 factor, ECF subfamily
MAIATALVEERPRLVRIAYRMLGSLADAEDVVGNVSVDALAADAEPENAAGFLTTLTVRRSLDLLRLRYRDRRVYTGTWLPEPVVTEISERPAAAGEREAELSIGFLQLAESLSPPQRAVVILRSLDYPHAEIAELLEISTVASRQYEHRARTRLGSAAAELDHGRTDVVDHADHQDSRQARRLLRGFLSAARDGDTDRLINLLHQDVIGYSDGGGRVRAARNPIAGRAKIARFAIGIAARNPDPSGRFVLINDRPGMIIWLRGNPHLLTLDVRNGCIHRLYDVSNPDKHQMITESADRLHRRQDAVRG